MSGASILTVIINGGVSMVVFFIVNKILFNDPPTSDILEAVDEVEDKEKELVE